jgi:MFS family permease
VGLRARLWPRAGLWRDTDFLQLWGAATVSQLGSQITLLALPLVAVLVLDASAFQVALLTTFDFLPFLLFGLPAGVWVDRLPRRPVMIATDVGRAVALLTIPLAYAMDVLTLAQLYTAGFLVGVMTVFFELAHTSFVPSLVERERLIEGNSKLEISRSSAYIAGPGLGGVLVGLLTAPGAIVFDAASFVVSALLVLRIRARERWVASAGVRTGVRRELAEGLRYVAGHRYLWPVASCTAILNLFFNAAFAVYFVFLARELDLRPALIGLVLTLGSLGWLAGALVAGRVTGRLGVGWTLAGASFLFCPSNVLVAVAPKSAPLPFLIAAQGLGSFAGVLYTITSMTLRQSVTPNRLQGRTVGAIRTVVWGVTPVGALLGGALATVAGLRATFWIAAIGGASAALPILLSSARSLRRMPEPEPEPAS